MTTFTHAIRGIGPYRIRLIERPYALDEHRWYHLMREGGLFPVASGPMRFIRLQFHRLMKADA